MRWASVQVLLPRSRASTGHSNVTLEFLAELGCEFAGENFGARTGSAHPCQSVQAK